MRHRFAVALIALAAISVSVVAQSSRPDLPLTLNAFAVSPGGPRTSAVASQVDITINRWSTSAESERLLAVLKEKGPDKLLDALQDVKSVGTIRTPGNLAYDLRYAYSEPGEDGGTRIFLATDRPVSYWEAVSRPRLSDYPFTFIELRLNGRGEGEGKLALATKINTSKDGKTIELENYDAQPIALNEVRRKGR
ncbi:MAG TPA: hypothetical protein VF491_24470 [Vicinamibacterales bacterium]